MNLVNFLSCTCAGVPIDDKLVGIVQLIYKAIQIGVPIILIIIGMFDMGKAITQQKEDEIKKAQSLLVKKAIAAALVFLMFSIVSLVLSVVGGNDEGNVSCIKCLLTGEGETTTTPTTSTTSNGSCYILSGVPTSRPNDPCKNGKNPQGIDDDFDGVYESCECR